MKRLLFTLGILSSVANAQNTNQNLTVEKIMRDPKWIGSSPSQVFWNYSSKSLYFKWNPEKALSDSTYFYPVVEKVIKKASYQDALLAESIHQGVYNSSHSKIVFLFKGDLYLLNISDQSTLRITHTEESKTDPGFSHLDEWVTYISKNDLYAWNIPDGKTIQLTRFVNADTPTQKKLTDQQQWLMNQQLQTSEIIRKRKLNHDAHTSYLKSLKETDTLPKIYTGDKEVQNLQISPDGRFITYNLVEHPANAKTTVVPRYVTETGFTQDIPGRTKVGSSQNKSTSFVFDRSKDSIIRVQTDSIPGISDQPDFIRDYPEKYKGKKATARDLYIASFSWNEEGSACVLDIYTNDNKDRWLMLLNPSSGGLTLLDRQRDEAWIAGPGINSLENAGFLGWIDNKHIYFQSESTGYSHLYSMDIQTHSKKTITQGNYEVLHTTLSLDKKYFYILTNEEHPGKKQLFRILVNGKEKQKLSSMEGGYEISFSPDEKYIAYRYSYQNKPWELFIQENVAGAKPVQITHMAMSEEWKAYPWRDTKIFSFAARDGKQVYARIYEPPADKKNNAAVIFVHGAGYLQNVEYSWSYYFHEFMFNNLLADKGYTVMDVDYRGSAGYGRDWRTAIYRYMGGKDLDDEVDAAKYLVKTYGIDSSRIGLYGGSYGGFIALMALFTKPGIFKAGAALRPVTDWAHYNHEYTSEILNEPFTDSLAYQRSSPINFAEGLNDHLLICHGMVDENVHFEDAVRLVQRLIELGKNNWELAVFPVEDHGFVEPSSWTDEYKRILKLFDTYLR